MVGPRVSISLGSLAPPSVCLAMSDGACDSAAPPPPPCSVRGSHGSAGPATPPAAEDRLAGVEPNDWAAIVKLTSASTLIRRSKSTAERASDVSQDLEAHLTSTRQRIENFMRGEPMARTKSRLDAEESRGLDAFMTSMSKSVFEARQMADSEIMLCLQTSAVNERLRDVFTCEKVARCIERRTQRLQRDALRRLAANAAAWVAQASAQAAAVDASAASAAPAVFSEVVLTCRTCSRPGVLRRSAVPMIPISTMQSRCKSLEPRQASKGSCGQIDEDCREPEVENTPRGMPEYPNAPATLPRAKCSLPALPRGPHHSPRAEPEAETFVSDTPRKFDTPQKITDPAVRGGIPVSQRSTANEVWEPEALRSGHQDVDEKMTQVYKRYEAAVERVEQAAVRMEAAATAATAIAAGRRSFTQTIVSQEDTQAALPEACQGDRSPMQAYQGDKSSVTMNWMDDFFGSVLSCAGCRARRTMEASQHPVSLPPQQQHSSVADSRVIESRASFHASPVRTSPDVL